MRERVRRKTPCICCFTSDDEKNKKMLDIVKSVSMNYDEVFCYSTEWKNYAKANYILGRLLGTTKENVISIFEAVKAQLDGPSKFSYHLITINNYKKTKTHSNTVNIDSEDKPSTSSNPIYNQSHNNENSTTRSSQQLYTNLMPQFYSPLQNSGSLISQSLANRPSLVINTSYQNRPIIHTNSQQIQNFVPRQIQSTISCSLGSSQTLQQTPSASERPSSLPITRHLIHFPHPLRFIPTEGFLPNLHPRHRAPLRPRSTFRKHPYFNPDHKQ